MLCDQLRLPQRQIHASLPYVLSQELGYYLKLTETIYEINNER